MTWFKVDDTFHSHNKIRKVLADDPAALALWVVAGSWSSANLTDGLIPDHQLAWLYPADPESLARKLVAARLWRRVRGGYLFHDWEQCNPTAEQVRSVRLARAEAGRKGGTSRGKAQSKAEANAQAIASANGKQNRTPSRPDPPPSKEGGEGGARHAAHGAARAPLSPTHAPNHSADEIPDWRTMPAAGQISDEQRQFNHERAKAASAAIKKPTPPEPKPSSTEPDNTAPPPPPAGSWLADEARWNSSTYALPIVTPKPAEDDQADNVVPIRRTS